MGSGILKLVAQRLALGILLLLAVSVLIFAGTQILPGDVAQSILGQSATPQAVANLRAAMGLNDPAYVRYFHWLWGLVHGDLGNALSNGQPIGPAIAERLGNTLFLAFWAAAVSIPLSIILGLIAVRHKNGFIDNLISASTLAAISLPEFFIGYILIYLIAVEARLVHQRFHGLSRHAFPQANGCDRTPATTLTLVVLAQMMRMTRAAILNVMQSAYVETAELKGLSPFEIIWKHAFPNAIAPIVNVIMLSLAYLVVGVVVIEVIFVYPGMGQYLVDHVAKRDVPVVQDCGLIFAAVYIGLNMLADIFSILSNPRLRHPK